MNCLHDIFDFISASNNRRSTSLCLQFKFSKKATKIWQIFQLIWRFLSRWENNWEISFILWHFQKTWTLSIVLVHQSDTGISLFCIGNIKLHCGVPSSPALWICCITNWLTSLVTVNDVTGKDPLKRPLKNCKWKFEGSSQVEMPQQKLDLSKGSFLVT